MKREDANEGKRESGSETAYMRDGEGGDEPGGSAGKTESGSDVEVD